MRHLFIICFIALFTQLCFAQTFKLGAFANFNRDITEYRGDNVIYRYKVGARASYSPWYRFSIEPGIAVSTQQFSDDVKVSGDNVIARAKYDLGNNNFVALQSHQMTTLSPSIGILFKTNQHKGCVTFITLSLSQNYTIREKENFVNYTQAETLTINDDIYSNSESQFEYQGTEIDFSFGAYWHVENFDGEIRLEPKFNLYRKRASNPINTAPKVNLYSENTRGYANMGFEISILKNMRKRRDIGNNRSEPWY